MAGLGTLLLSPVLVAASPWRSSCHLPGPVLYRQARVGHRGRPFTMLKFRTMRVGADAMVDELREAARGDRADVQAAGRPARDAGWAAFLRKWSLDELPQLINVLRGRHEPRGPAAAAAARRSRSYEDWQFDRLEVPPGISGLWQVSGRSDLSFDDCVRLDLFYIENWSLAYDLYILAKTVPVLISQRGAY